MENYYIGKDGARALAEALKVNRTVTKLDLGYSRIGDVGARALAEALKVNETVTALSLPYNQIGDVGARALAEALQTNGAVTALDLGKDYDIGNDGARIRAETTIITQANALATKFKTALTQPASIPARGILTQKDVDFLSDLAHPENSLIVLRSLANQSVSLELATLPEHDPRARDLEFIKIIAIAAQNDPRLEGSALKEITINIRPLPVFETLSPDSDEIVKWVHNRAPVWTTREVVGNMEVTEAAKVAEAVRYARTKQGYIARKEAAGAGVGGEDAITTNAGELTEAPISQPATSPNLTRETKEKTATITAAKADEAKPKPTRAGKFRKAVEEASGIYGAEPRKNRTVKKPDFSIASDPHNPNASNILTREYSAHNTPTAMGTRPSKIQHGDVREVSGGSLKPKASGGRNL